MPTIASPRCAALRGEARAIWQAADILLLPTTGTIYRVAEIAADPLRLNTQLGFYTNFVNLFDLAAIAVPNGYQLDGMPAGMTLIAPAWHEAPLAAIGAAFHPCRRSRAGSNPRDPAAAGTAGERRLISLDPACRCRRAPFGHAAEP